MSRSILATSKHKEMVTAASSSGELSTFFRPSPTEEAVTQAEVLFVNFVAEHNLSFLMADHFTHLTSAMFPDSKIAQAFSTARTKTTCTGTLHPHFITPVIKLCREDPLSYVKAMT